MPLPSMAKTDLVEARDSRPAPNEQNIYWDHTRFVKQSRRRHPKICWVMKLVTQKQVAVVITNRNYTYGRTIDGQTGLYTGSCKFISTESVRSSTAL